MKEFNRRDFIKLSGAAAASAIMVPTIISSCARSKKGQVAPSDRINMGIIGSGNQAMN